MTPRSPKAEFSQTAISFAFTEAQSSLSSKWHFAQASYWSILVKTSGPFWSHRGPHDRAPKTTFLSPTFFQRGPPESPRHTDPPPLPLAQTLLPCTHNRGKREEHLAISAHPLLVLSKRVISISFRYSDGSPESANSAPHPPDFMISFFSISDSMKLASPPELFANPFVQLKSMGVTSSHSEGSSMSIMSCFLVTES